MKVKVLTETSSGKTVYETLDEFFGFVFKSDPGNVILAHQKAEYVFRQQIISQLGHDPLLDLLRALNCSYAAFFAIVAEPVAPKIVTDQWTATVYRDILTLNPDIQQLAGDEARQLYHAKVHTGTVEVSQDTVDEKEESKLRQVFRWLCWRS